DCLRIRRQVGLRAHFEGKIGPEHHNEGTRGAPGSGDVLPRPQAGNRAVIARARGAFAGWRALSAEAGRRLRGPDRPELLARVSSAVWLGGAFAAPWLRNDPAKGRYSFRCRNGLAFSPVYVATTWPLPMSWYL